MSNNPAIIKISNNKVITALIITIFVPSFVPNSETCKGSECFTYLVENVRTFPITRPINTSFELSIFSFKNPPAITIAA